MLSVTNLIGFGAGRSTGNIQFVGGKTGTKAGNATNRSTMALDSGLTGGISSSVAAGDLVIAAFAVGSNANVAMSITDGTSDYTTIGSELYVSDDYATNLLVAYKFMPATPDATVSFGPTQSINYAGAMAVYVFRGVDSSNPLDVAAVTATGLSSVLANPPSITPSSDGAFIVCVGAGGHLAGTVEYSSSDLTDFLSAGFNDALDVTIGIGHKPDWSGGAFNAAAFTFGLADNAQFSWAAVSLALRPA